jgi:hypothetical protein
MDRKSKDTKFGVHVKALVFNANDEVLVLKTKEGQWDLPGGAVQFGENVYNAVWRTIKDTTDLDADILKPSDVWTLKILNTYILSVLHSRVLGLILVMMKIQYSYLKVMMSSNGYPKRRFLKKIILSG